MKINKTELDSRAVELKDALVSYYKNLDKLVKLKSQYATSSPSMTDQDKLDIIAEIRSLEDPVFKTEQTVTNTVKWFRAVGYPNALKEWCKLNRLTTKLNKFKKTHKIK